MNNQIILFDEDEEFLIFSKRKNLENIWYKLPEITNLIE